MEKLIDEARALPAFRCEEIDRNQLAKEWKAWKSGLEIYFEAYDVTDQRKMRAKLLHFGGKQLQKVFDSFPDNAKLPLVSTKANWYDIAVSRLDDYFEPGRQYILERCRLRKLRQERNERFAHFVMRIRQQLADCGLEKYSVETKEVLTEIFIIDTIAEGCCSDELRRRILQKDRSLAEVEELGATMEGVEQQLKDIGSLKVPEPPMEKAFRVEAGHHAGYGRKNNGMAPNRKQFRDDSGRNQSIVCFNCGTTGHVTSSYECKARNQVCRRCKKVGHFEAVCRKRFAPRSGSHVAPQKFKKVRLIDHGTTPPVDIQQDPLDSKQEKKVYYSFYSGNKSNMLQCVIGGVPLGMLVDSGSDANLIDSDTWIKLKQQLVVVSDMQKGSDQVLRGYGSSKPLEVLGTFRAKVSIETETITAKFFVVQAGQCCLLGNETAKALGVLKIGVGVNRIEDIIAPFGKIKDVQVHIHMDPSFKPVFQPVRRVPIPYEAAVDKKLEQMLALDIIEVK